MQGQWIRKPQYNASVVFVHGILSNSDDCWRHDNRTYWPELLMEEKELEGLGIYVFTYRSDIFSGNYQLGDAVDSLKEHLRLDNVMKDQMIFVCHSMGGIIVRQFLVVQQTDLINRNIEVGLFLVASPSLGATYANLLSVFARALGNSQAQ